jgi:aminopeptidase N
VVDVIEFNKGKAMTLSRKHTLIIITLPAILLLSCQAVLRATSTPTAIPAPTPATVPTLPPADVQAEYGIGDPYFPDLGNPGYDVQNYVIALDVDPESGEISGKTTIEAVAKTDLSSFNLDFQGFEIGGLTVNGSTADYTRDDRELIITPGKPLQAGDAFTVEVAYNGIPQPAYYNALDFKMGWLQGTSKAINVLSEPDGASSWYPVNDHPLDKATYRFEISVPQPWVVAATGNLLGTESEGNKVRYIWEMDKPMASYLASVNIDHYILQESMGPGGVMIRNYIPDDVDPLLTRDLDQLPEMLDYFSGLFGPYPFEEYGVLIADETIGPCLEGSLSLEAQSLSIHCPSEFMLSRTVLAHELAHQWFGDSVSLERWQDIWLKEGFATYSSWLWESRGQGVDSITAYADIQRNLYPIDEKIGQPPPDELYDWESYDGGAMVLHALRLQVGDEAFFDILRTYLERYRYGNAGTEEFIAVAEEVSGQELSGFFDSWLMQTDLPDFPNR